MSEKTIERPTTDEAAIAKEIEAEEKAAARQASLLKDGWADLRKRPMFLVTAFIIVCLLTLAIVPGLFTARSPFSDGFCQLQNSRNGPSSRIRSTTSAPRVIGGSAQAESREWMPASSMCSITPPR